jgi:hypothetical protein
MKIQEFSDTFDTLLNSYANRIEAGSEHSRADVALNEYEKSVFLTKAQEQLVISFYSGRNSMGTSFEETEEMRRYVAPIVKEAYPDPVLNTSGKQIGMGNSKFYSLPEDCWFITYESYSVTRSEGKCTGEAVLDVVPVTQDEYHKIKRNPFRGANSRRALRLDLSERVVEIVCKSDSTSNTPYYIRYLKRPNPIVLIDLSDTAFSGEDMDYLKVGENLGPSECELPEALHQTIVESAVMLALRSKGIKTND